MALQALAGNWIDAHGVTVGLLGAVVGWCWKIDRAVAVMSRDVQWLRKMGCARVDECAAVQQHKRKT